MLVDTYVPMVGFNQTFSYLKNFEISLSPVEEGFKGDKFFFIKRPGFWTKKNIQDQYVWQLDGNYVGKYVYHDITYVWDDLGKVYKFYKDSTNNYVLEKIYDNPDGLYVYIKDTQDNYVQQRALTVNYVTEKQKEFTIESANNFAGDGDIVQIVAQESNTFLPEDVGKLLYFPYDNIPEWRFMVRRIVEVVDDRTVNVSEQFYVDPVTSDPNGQKCEVYDRIDEVIIFNNIKDPTTDRVLTMEISTEQFHLRLMGGKDIALYDGRLWTVTMDGSSVGGSFLTGEYEILDPNVAFGDVITQRGEKVLSIYPYKMYLLVFYKTMISVIRQIGTDEDENPIYNWNVILGETGIFSPESYIVKEGNLYVFTIGKKFCSLEIKPQYTNMIDGVLQSQADIIQHKLNEVNYGQRVFLFSYDVGVGMGVSDEYGTKIWKYTFDYKGWYYHESKKEWKSYYSRMYADWINGIERRVVLRGGESDLGEDIEQEVQIVGPKQTYGDAFTILQLKVLLGFYDNPQDFEIELELGHEKFIVNVFDNSQGIHYVTWQNIASGDGSLSTVPVGYNLLGGINTLKEKINKIGLMSLRVGKSGVYYKFTIRNRNNSNFNFGYLGVQYKQGNPLVAPIMNVT